MTEKIGSADGHRSSAIRHCFFNQGGSIVPTARTRVAFTGLLLMPLATAVAEAADGPAPQAAMTSVVEIQAAHDRALIRDLVAYLGKSPRADDLDQAYMTLFDKVIEHDWFADHETVAKRYLAERPDGPVRSLAQIVATMARAHANDFAGALARYNELMGGLGKPEQEEFAANFTDSLASAAVAAGEYQAARNVYQGLLDRYGESPTLRQKVRAELTRLDKVGKPAPEVVARDVAGERFRLDGLRGKYVLLDFWATWCAPCVAEVPRLQAAYAKYHDQGFEIVGVSLDETKTAVTDFAKARNLPWRQIHNASSEADLVEAFGVGSIPATFLIDPQGVITRLDLRGPSLEQALARLIKGQASARSAR
jgi:peroxiredoxin